MEIEKNSWFDDEQFREDQKQIKKRILERPLPRPKTNLFHVLLWVLIYALVSFFSAFAVIHAFDVTGGEWLIYLGSFLIFLLLFFKKICISSIECYQHYAKEETRRRCMCIPSCSEYSIAVLKKYNIFKAINKIRIRLFKTCGSVGYVHDEP